MHALAEPAQATRVSRNMMPNTTRIRMIMPGMFMKISCLAGDGCS